MPEKIVAETAEKEEKKTQEFYVFWRAHALSGWIQSLSVWTTLDEACAEAEQWEIENKENITKDSLLLVCLSENGSYPTPFFNWLDQE